LLVPAASPRSLRDAARRGGARRHARLRELPDGGVGRGDHQAQARMPGRRGAVRSGSLAPLGGPGLPPRHAREAAAPPARGTVGRGGGGGGGGGEWRALLAAGDRRRAGRTAPAHGLTLEWVRYDPPVG